MLSLSPDALLLASFTVTAAALDLRTRRIPNWLNFAGLGLAFGLNLVLHQVPGLWQFLGGLVLAFGVYFVLYLLRAVGAADVKMMATVGAIVGPVNWVAIFVVSALVGGVLAVVVVLWHKRVRRTVFNLGYLVYELMHLRAPYLRRDELDVAKGLSLPHAVSVAAGSLLFVAWRAGWLAG